MDVDLQALEDVLKNTDGTAPVICQLPFEKARDVRFCIFISFSPF